MQKVRTVTAWLKCILPEFGTLYWTITHLNTCLLLLTKNGTDAFCHQHRHASSTDPLTCTFTCIVHQLVLSRYARTCSTPVLHHCQSVPAAVAGAVDALNWCWSIFIFFATLTPYPMHDDACCWVMCIIGRDSSSRSRNNMVTLLVSRLLHIWSVVGY